MTEQHKEVVLKSSNCISDGWFSEVEPMWPGQKLSIALESFSTESIIFNEHSDFQSILVFKSAQHGNVLVLDGVIQLTEGDEFVYQEMISHLPMMVHLNPKKILIVGGGDGGVLREVCKHECVESITLVEIDKKVISVSKLYFSESTATCFDDPRVTIINKDAAQFLEDQNRNCRVGYDVIIADTSDPVGPAESLFDPIFYDQMFEALNEKGIVCAQGECFWTHPRLIENVIACCSDLFDCVEYSSTYVPTYPCGQIGFIIASKGRVDLKKPKRMMPKELQSQLKWYTPSIHSSSFVLPKFMADKLAPYRQRFPHSEEDQTSHKASHAVKDLSCLSNPCLIQ